MAPQLLTFVNEDAPILHRPAADVAFPLSDADQQLVASIRWSIQPPQLAAADAAWDSAAGMAANQWGQDRRMFAWFPQDALNEPAQIVFNPSYVPIAPSPDTLDKAVEGCFSVPKAFGQVERHLYIRVQYQDETGQEHTAELKGRDARVWSHENDHLDGFLYTTTKRGVCSDFRRFETKAEAIKERLLLLGAAKGG